MILDYEGKGLTAKPVIVKSIRGALEDIPWPYSLNHKLESQMAWERVRAKKPALFNGDILMSLAPEMVSHDTATIRLFKAKYADMLYWQSDKSVNDDIRLPYAVPAPITTDGYFVVGVMAMHTANSGMAYFPSGTFSLEDIAGDGSVDFQGSMLRELEEECGFSRESTKLGKEWLILETPKSRSCFLTVFLSESSKSIDASFRRFISNTAEDELSSIRLVNNRSDLHGLELPIAQKRYFDLLFEGRIDNLISPS
jgi:hypothetical protein